MQGCADILMEMRWDRRPTDADRRRRLLGLSRYDETPRELVIELNAAGTDYLARASLADEEFASHWRLLEGLLRQADTKLSRDEILASWPASFLSGQGFCGPGGRAVLIVLYGFQPDLWCYAAGSRLIPLRYAECPPNAIGNNLMQH
jgi:hypothetical protein